MMNREPRARCYEGFVRVGRPGTVTPALENFTRVETFGTPYHHWVHVTVDANDPNVFTFRPRIVAANLTQRQ